MCEQWRAIKNALDNSHPAHYESVLLSCKTGAQHQFFPEIDFENASQVAFVESYLALKNIPNAMEVTFNADEDA
ncbi:hypothetical protein [Vibrio phage VCPH]|nr:hypothetical protein [Vibrio phage VCPH]